MAKGLAVVSGSNDVVFKALETGVITLGSAVTDAVVTVTGSLTINKHADGGDPLVVTGLTQDAVSTGNNILIINGSGIVREAQSIDSDNVYFTGSAQTLTEFSASVVSALGASDLTVSGSTGSGDVNLANGSLVLVSPDSNISITVTDNGNDLTASVALSANPSVTTLTASSGVSVTAGGVNVTAGGVIVTDGNISTANGDVSASAGITGGTLTIAGAADLNSTLAVASTVTVESGDVLVQGGNVQVTGSIFGTANLDLVGSASIGGDLTVTGDLTILGETTILETTNLRVEDPIIILGSSSVATTGDRGFIFQQSGGNQSFIYESTSGKYLLGSTAANGTDTNVTVTNDATLLLNTLSASYIEVSADLNVQGNTILGDAGTDSVTINGFITGSGNIIVSSSLTIGDASISGGVETTTFVSQVRMPIFSVSGANAVAGFPVVPPDYITNSGSYGGHMFYLTSSSGFPNWNGDNDWDEGNKWYFNERGRWHESFFFHTGNFN